MTQSTLSWLNPNPEQRTRIFIWPNPCRCRSALNQDFHRTRIFMRPGISTMYETRILISSLKCREPGFSMQRTRILPAFFAVNQDFAFVFCREPGFCVHSLQRTRSFARYLCREPGFSHDFYAENQDFCTLSMQRTRIFARVFCNKTGLLWCMLSAIKALHNCRPAWP